jgi:hypothetical protein
MKKLSSRTVLATIVLALTSFSAAHAQGINGTAKGNAPLTSKHGTRAIDIYLYLDGIGDIVERSRNTTSQPPPPPEKGK